MAQDDKSLAQTLRDVPKDTLDKVTFGPQRRAASKYIRDRVDRAEKYMTTPIKLSYPGETEKPKTQVTKEAAKRAQRKAAGKR